MSNATMNITNVQFDNMGAKDRPHFSFTNTVTMPNGTVTTSEEVWVLVEDRDPREKGQYRRTSDGWVVSVDTREQLVENLARILDMSMQGERPLSLPV